MDERTVELPCLTCAEPVVVTVSAVSRRVTLEEIGAEYSELVYVITKATHRGTTMSGSFGILCGGV